MKLSSVIVALLMVCSSAFAQTPPAEKWDLQKCVEYAMQNNISVRQADLQIRFAELDLHQSKQSIYPNANFSGNVGFSAGRNQDPTTFSLITTGFIFNNYTLQTSVDLFNWFSKKNTIAANDLTVKARQEGLEKAKNDVALNVA
ncbi:MAG: TolC family protein, partial [Chitinophagaceae bacterium]|nr:TolC family protein [Chitinophagaceae bacterium]